LVQRRASLRRVAKEIERELTRLYGPLVGGDDLVRCCGLKTGAAFRQARARGSLPIPVFPLQGRRGTYAFVADVAAWLASQQKAVARATSGAHKPRKQRLKRG